MTEHIPIIGMLVAILGIVSAISYKFYRDSTKDHTVSGYDKGKVETSIEYLKDGLIHVEQLIQNIEDDVEKGHLDYDSFQKQIADIRERLARVEGPR